MATMRSPERPASGDHLGREDHTVRAAMRFAVLTAGGGVAFLILAALWVSTCGDSTAVDTAACGGAQRTLLGLGSPIILLVGALWAFVRTYQVWRAEGTWWGWQGAGWFLLTLMLVMLTMGFPAVAGPALGGG